MYQYWKVSEIMTYIYGIFVSGDCYYIGQTENIERRFKEHAKAIENGKHSVKAFNKVDINEVEMRVIAELNCDNSLLVCMVEGLYNSIYKPKNKIVWRSGKNAVTYSRVEKDIARRLLGELITLGVVKECKECTEICTKVDIKQSA